MTFPLWGPLFAILTVATILGLASLAHAASLPIGGPLPSAAAPPLAQEDDEEAEAAEVEEEESEACEEVEEEKEDEECAEEGATAQEAADACMLKSTEATVLVLPTKDLVRLTVRYTTLAPSVVSVQYSLRGRRGGLKMGPETDRFSRKGVFHETEKLTENEMARVKAATEFDVNARAVNTPGYCGHSFESKLTVRHAAHGGVTWTD